MILGKGLTHSCRDEFPNRHRLGLWRPWKMKAVWSLVRSSSILSSDQDYHPHPRDDHHHICISTQLRQVSQPPVIHGIASAMTRVLLPRPFPGKTLRNGHHSLCVGLTCLNSIVVSIFVDILVELTNTISEDKIQIILLIVRRGALSDVPSQRSPRGRRPRRWSPTPV